MYTDKHLIYTDHYSVSKSTGITVSCRDHKPCLLELCVGSNQHFRPGVFLSTWISTCVARAACFVFGSVFITTFLFSFFLFYKLNRHLCHGAYWYTHNHAHKPRLLFNCIFLPLLPAYVCRNLCPHCPPIPYSYTFIAVSICMFCVLLYSHNHLFVQVCFFLLYTSNRYLCHGAYWCTHPAHMPRLLFQLHLHSSNSCVYVSELVYAFPSNSILIYTYRHIYMYICDDYSVMTP